MTTETMQLSGSETEILLSGLLGPGPRIPAYESPTQPLHLQTTEGGPGAQAYQFLTSLLADEVWDAANGWFVAWSALWRLHCRAETTQPCEVTDPSLARRLRRIGAVEAVRQQALELLAQIAAEEEDTEEEQIAPLDLDSLKRSRF